jgi:all-beta uncharacterized protein
VRSILPVAFCLVAVWACSNSPTTPGGSTACSYTLSPTSQSTTASGGQASATVTRSAGTCGWTAAADASWITLSTTSGSDTGTIAYSVGGNTSTDARTGHITVSWTGGSAQLTISQAGQTSAPVQCAYAIDPTGITIPAAGGSGTATVTVTGTSGCSWSAQSNQNFIHITSGTSGTSTGTISYSVDANPGVERFGRIIVTHTLGTTDISFTQPAAVCSATLNPTLQTVATAGGLFTVALTAPLGCAWTAASDTSWLTISSATSGSGSATISYAVAANTGPDRTAHVTVTSGATSAQLTVLQAPAGTSTAVFDSALRAPACRDPGTTCNSGTLLNGSGSNEMNQPNTIANSCPDGSATGHLAVVDSIRIATIDNSTLASGSPIIVEARIRLAGTAGHIRAYRAPDALNPVWTLIQEQDVTPSIVAFPMSFNWPSGGASLQAVRFAFSARGSTGEFFGPCAIGPDDDTDDLVFRVQ